MKTNFASIEKPTVGITINKSRLKLYNKDGNIPVYYLQKGQEFQIELFNPTSDTILAKIHLNDKMISQGGLVLRPGERVFLDRYFDVAKKFMFDTYEVGSSEAVKKAIQDNGDVKVEFYREVQQTPYFPLINISGNLRGMNNTTAGNVYGNPAGTKGIHTQDLGRNIVGSTAEYSANYFNSDITFTQSGLNTTLTSSATLDMLSDEVAEPKTKTLKKRSMSKTIETGRVEQGSESNQKFEYVSKSFEWAPFHTVEYKLLPISQKVNTVGEMKVRIHCTNCGSKAKPTDKFCANCGNKI
jgi:hypothetical protein